MQSDYLFLIRHPSNFHNACPIDYQSSAMPHTPLIRVGGFCLIGTVQSGIFRVLFVFASTFLCYAWLLVCAFEGYQRSWAWVMLNGVYWYIGWDETVGERFITYITIVYDSFFFNIVRVGWVDG
jgi:hypothetical protein